MPRMRRNRHAVQKRITRWNQIGAAGEPDDQKFVWRFMSLSKLLWTIQKQQLFFPSLTELRKSDPYEGLVPKSLYNHFEEWGTQVRQNGEVVATGVQMAHKMADRSFVNCWHLNPNESVAMWKLYSDPNGAVLRSTVARLDQGITPPENGTIYMVQVSYTPYESSKHIVMAPGPELAIPNFKDASLNHENEIRLVFQPEGFPSRPIVYVNLKEVAESILLSPIADPWLPDCVNELLGRFSLPPICRKSELRTLSF